MISIAELTTVSSMRLQISSIASVNATMAISHAAGTILCMFILKTVVGWNDVDIGVAVGAILSNVVAVFQHAIDQLENAVESAQEAIRKLRLLKFRVFPVFEVLTPNIYRFNVNCLKFNPSWYVLTYMANKGLRDINRDRATGGKDYLRRGRFNSLDEFPYASTYEGGYGALVAAVPARENSRQGAHLRWFYHVVCENKPTEFFVLPIPNNLLERSR